MAGLAAAIGGAGQVLEKRNEQIRGIMERQREGYAQMLAAKALQEQNPEYAKTYMQAAHDAYSGVPFNKLIPPVIKTLQSAQADHQLIGQLIPPSAQPNTPAPGPGSGTGGAFGNLLANAKSSAPAAQPASSPVSPQEQTTQKIAQQFMGSILPMQAQNQPQAQPQVSPIAQPPVTVTSQGAASQAGPIENPDVFAARQTRNQYILEAEQMKRNSPSAMWQGIDEDLKLKLANLQPIEDQARRRAAFEAFKQTPEYAESSPMQRSAWAAESYGMSNIPGMGNLMGRMIAPHSRPMTAADAVRMYPQETAAAGITPDYQGPVSATFTMADPNHPFMLNNVPVRKQLLAGEDQYGNYDPYYANPYAAAGPVGAPSGINPAVNSQFAQHNVSMANGQFGTYTGAGLRAGLGLTPLPGSSVPGLATTTHSTSTTPLPGGGTATSSQTRKTPAGGGSLPNINGAPTPAPTPAPSNPSKPTATAPAPPFGSSPWDWAVKQAAEDQANINRLPSQARVAVQNRMGQLGIDPNNVTNSMREQSKRASNVLDHIDHIEGLINSLGPSEINLLASRWNDFLLGKVGKDFTDQQLYAKFKTDMGFLTTAVGMTHGGLRAGSSEPIIAHWEKVLEAPDLPTIMAKLQETRGWMQGYKNFVGVHDPDTRNKLNMPPEPQTPTPAPSVINVVRDPKTGKLVVQ